MSNIQNPADAAALQVLRWKEDFPSYAEEILKIRTKAGGIVPFKLNRAQRHVWKLIKQDIDAKRPVRIFLLKARQLGMSTFSEGIGYWFLTLHTHRDGLVVAHNADAAQGIFSMMQLMWAESPEAVRPLRRISNRREMWWANPSYPQDGSGNPGLQSRVTIATADNKNFGVSGTIQFAHLSEFARYPEVNNDISATMKTFRQAVPRMPGTFVIYETTAKGLNLAYDVWMDQHNGIRKVFISWIADDTYTMPKPLDEKDLEDRPEGRYGDELEIRDYIIRELEFWYEEKAKDPSWLLYESLKRLAWRRAQIDEEFDGDKTLFRQEHPITPQEAFITSGNHVFSIAKLSDISDKLIENPPNVDLFAFDKQARRFYRSKGRSRLFQSNNKLSRDRAYEVAIRAGDLRVYELPQEGVRYAIGADVAEGYDDRDYSAAHVIRIPDFTQVAVAQIRIDPDDFANYLATLGYMYNRAWIAVEITGSGLATQLALKKNNRYPMLYRRQVFDSTNRSLQTKYGWSTNRASKPIMINVLKGVFRDDILILRDLPTIREMMSYVEIEHGKTGAATGNDDLVMALAIAWQMVEQLGVTQNLRVVDGKKFLENPPPEKTYGTLAWWERIIDKQAEFDALGQRDYGEVGDGW